MQGNNHSNNPIPNGDKAERPQEASRQPVQEPMQQMAQQTTSVPILQSTQQPAQEPLQQPTLQQTWQSVQSNAAIPPTGEPLPPFANLTDAAAGPKENFLKRQYREAWRFFKGQLKWIFLAVILFFVLLIVLTELYFLKNPAEINEAISSFRESISDIDMGSSSSASYGIFLNNLRACAIGWILGFVPFLFLPALSLIGNAAIMGAISGMYAISGMSVAKMYIFGIMPHGIFELPAIFLSIAMGIFTCYSLVVRICEAKYHKGQVKYAAVNCLRLYLCYILPLLIVAGFIEGFVTPLLIDRFLV